MPDNKVLFTIEEDEKLVDIVSKFPVIYDLSSPLYKNQTVKDNAWKEIAESVKRTVDDCKKRWRNIKDTYHKRQKKGKGTGSSASSKGKKWALADMLTFLKQVDHTRESISNVQFEESDTEDIDDSILPDTPEGQSTSQSSNTKDKTSQNVGDVPSFRPPSKRVRHNDKILDMLESRRIERQGIMDSLTAEKRDDAIDLFFKSIASSVKKLRIDLINEAKMKSLQMIIDLESRNSSTYFNFPSENSTASSCYSSQLTSSALSPVDNTTVSSNDNSNEFPANYFYLTGQSYESL